jgi:hypothetical protein
VSLIEKALMDVRGTTDGLRFRLSAARLQLNGQGEKFINPDCKIAGTDRPAVLGRSSFRCGADEAIFAAARQSSLFKPAAKCVVYVCQA